MKKWWMKWRGAVIAGMILGVFCGFYGHWKYERGIRDTEARYELRSTPVPDKVVSTWMWMIDNDKPSLMTWAYNHHREAMMTKYEACVKLKEWGMKQELYFENCPWNAAIGQVEVKEPPLDALLSFAESLAERKWPGKWHRVLEHKPVSHDEFDTAHYVCYIWKQHDGTCLAAGESDIDDWWAVFNLIQAMMEG
jgi:hypothetical protein